MFSLAIRDAFFQEIFCVRQSVCLSEWITDIMHTIKATMQTIAN